jgi:hypothetical protein
LVTTLVMILFSLTAVLTYYMLARKSYVFVYVLCVGVVLEVLVIWLYHPSLITVAWILLIIKVIVLILGSFIITFIHKGGRN